MLAPSASVTNVWVDTDSLIIGIDTNASVTMAKHLDYFDDLVLNPNDNNIVTIFHSVELWALKY